MMLDHRARLPGLCLPPAQHHLACEDANLSALDRRCHVLVVQLNAQTQAGRKTPWPDEGGSIPGVPTISSIRVTASTMVEVSQRPHSPQSYNAEA
jgi:hypothetical protein